MAMTTNRMRSTVAYPPGHPRREQLRRGLRDLPATSVRINSDDLTSCPGPVNLHETFSGLAAQLVGSS